MALCLAAGDFHPQGRVNLQHARLDFGLQGGVQVAHAVGAQIGEVGGGAEADLLVDGVVVAGQGKLGAGDIVEAVGGGVGNGVRDGAVGDDHVINPGGVQLGAHLFGEDPLLRGPGGGAGRAEDGVGAAAA